MFTAYDDSGLTGDATVLLGLLGRPPTTWATCLSQASRLTDAGGTIAAMSDEQTWLDRAVDLATANVARVAARSVRSWCATTW